MNPPRPAAGQRGAALILALVVVSLVVILASSLGNDFVVGFRRVENQLYSQQAYALLRGAEGVARQLLQRDLRDSAAKDHASEGWLDQRQDFPTEYGIISGTVSDLQARLNLNMLMPPAGGQQTGYTRDQQRFIRLLQQLELEEPLDLAQSQQLCDALIDWLDKDSEQRPGGAESYYYEALDPPYRAANRVLSSVSELRWIKGFEEPIYRALRPFVTVFGSGDINVNTASLQVLRSINEDNNLQPLDLLVAESIIGERDGASLPGDTDTTDGVSEAMAIGGFDSVDIFQQQPWDKLDTGALVLKTQTVLLTAVTQFVDRQFSLQSVLQRDEQGAVITLARSSSSL